MNIPSGSSSHTRRARRWRIGAGAIAIATLSLAVELAQAQVQPRAVRLESIASQSYVVQIVGDATLRPLALAGGDVVGNVLLRTDAAGRPDKAIGGLAVTPLTLRLPVTGPLPAWVAETLTNGTTTPRDVAITTLDSAGQPQGQRDLLQTSLTGVAFPELNAAAREPGAITLRMAPASVRFSSGGATGGPSMDPRAGRPWLRSNFRLELGTLPTDRVSRVEPFTWTASAGTTSASGRQRASGGATLDNLKLQISTADLARWQEWMQSFLMNGQNTNDHELTGSLQLVGEDMQQVFLSIELHGVGLVSLTMPVLDGGVQPTFGAELYVTRIEIK